jgi:hypothetical protein
MSNLITKHHSGSIRMDQQTQRTGPPGPRSAVAKQSTPPWPESHTYRAPDLIPAAGPERTTAFVMIVLPLIVVVLIGLGVQATGLDPLKYVPGLSGFFGDSNNGDGSSQGGFNGSSQDGSTGLNQGAPYPGSGIAPPVNSATTDENPIAPTMTDSVTDAIVTSASDTPFTEPTSSTTATDSAVATATAGDPASVVEAYYAAINNRQYSIAWNLGGDNLGESFTKFEAGFANLDHDTLTVVSVQSGVVAIDLTAANANGIEQTFTGTYTVAGGVITGSDIRQTG